MDNAFGTWFAGQLRRREMKQADFHRASGFSTGAISDWVLGKRIPDPSSCDRIADVLGLPIDTVLEAAGHRPHISDVRDELEQELLVLFSALPSNEKQLVLEYARFRRAQVGRRG